MKRNKVVLGIFWMSVGALIMGLILVLTGCGEQYNKVNDCYVSDGPTVGVDAPTRAIHASAGVSCNTSPRSEEITIELQYEVGVQAGSGKGTGGVTETPTGVATGYWVTRKMKVTTELPGPHNDIGIYAGFPCTAGAWRAHLLIRGIDTDGNAFSNEQYSDTSWAVTNDCQELK